MPDTATPCRAQPGGGFEFREDLRSEVPDSVSAKTAALFAGLRQPNPALARALDLGATFRFSAPRVAEVDAMRTALELAP